MSLVTPTRYLALSLIVALAACEGSETGEKVPSPVSSNNTIGPVAQSRDTAPPTQETVIAVAAEVRDSADVFDPDGYYALTDTLRIDGRTIETLGLHTVDVYYGGQLHYDRPRLVQPPDVTLIISELSTGSDRDKAEEQDGKRESMHSCASARITPDSLSVRCVGTPVGDVDIEGHFLDKGRVFSSRFAERSVELLVARVVVRRDGRIIHEATHRFSYFVGD